MQWFSASQVAKYYGLAVATITGHIEDGTLGAINVARKTSKRKRYKSSDQHLADFEAARENPKPAAKESKTSRRTITKPTKDYFAATGGGK
jgi:hypothetical protein